MSGYILEGEPEFLDDCYTKQVPPTAQTVEHSTTKTDIEAAPNYFVGSLINNIRAKDVAFLTMLSFGLGSLHLHSITSNTVYYQLGSIFITTALGYGLSIVESPEYPVFDEQ